RRSDLRIEPAELVIALRQVVERAGQAVSDVRTPDAVDRTECILERGEPLLGGKLVGRVEHDRADAELRTLVDADDELDAAALLAGDLDRRARKAAVAQLRG